MRRLKALAGVLVLAVMMMCMSCFALAVNAAGEADDGAPQAVTAEIRHDDADAAEAAFSGDDTPEVIKTASSSSSREPNIVKGIIAGLLIAVIGTGIFLFTTINSYKNNGKTEPYPFSSKAPLSLKVKEDVLVNTEVTKRKIESSNNNR